MQHTESSHAFQDVTPLHDRVLVKIPVEEAKEETTPSGILVTAYPVEEQNTLRWVEVLKSGSGEILYDGKVRKLAVFPGDKVLVDEHDIAKIPLKNTLEGEYGLVSERALLALKRSNS